ncbi:hypothetical protein PM082_024927 [Marasmius tenuissimus]|nr:hypothetical protein PM082_024927 [Marasmius tenuissimus]
MFRNLPYLLLTVKLCACLASPSITIITPAVAAQGGDDHNDVFRNDFIQDEPTRYNTNVWGGPEVQKSPGTTAFTVTGTKKYRLEGRIIRRNMFLHGPPSRGGPGGGKNAGEIGGPGNGGPGRDGGPHGGPGKETITQPSNTPTSSSTEATRSMGGGTSLLRTTSSQQDEPPRTATKPVETPAFEATRSETRTASPRSSPSSVKSAAPSVDSHRLAKIIGSVLGVLFMLTLALIVYLYCRRRRARRIARIDAKSSISFQKERIMVSDRPWYKSPTYFFPRPWARSGYSPSEISSTSGSESKTHIHTYSELSFSTITPSDSVSQVGHASSVYKSHRKRKPLKSSTDLSAVSEARESTNPSSVNGSTKISGSEGLDHPKPVFPHPIPDIITTDATPQTSAVG